MDELPGPPSKYHEPKLRTDWDRAHWLVLGAGLYGLTFGSVGGFVSLAGRRSYERGFLGALYLLPNPQTGGLELRFESR